MLRVQVTDYPRERETNLESVLVTLGLSELLRDLTQLRDRNLIAFADPSVENISSAPLGESEPEDSAPEVVVFLRIQRLFKKLTTLSGRREKPRKISGPIKESPIKERE